MPRLRDDSPARTAPAAAMLAGRFAAVLLAIAAIAVLADLAVGDAAAGDAAAGDAASRGEATPPTRREDLVGAWKLVAIEVQGPNGAGRDPFYGVGSQGLLIYDSSGWFSVQIMGQRRPRLDPPASRPAAPSARRDGIKAAALDSYYAYYGIWSFDAASSTVTHQAVGAMYPGETGATYRQRVAVRGSRMIFTRTEDGAEHATVQTKVWERVGKP